MKDKIENKFSSLFCFILFNTFDSNEIIGNLARKKF